jgi:gliding motility-associated protein GldM
MASAKESPRQKMIGMMYLVLTALLALNVSKDILDAFVVVNDGLEKTNLNFSDRNLNLYSQFDIAKQVDPVRITPYWNMAQEVKKYSAELTEYIDLLQKDLVIKTDGVEKSVADTLKMGNIKSKDNYDIPTNILIGDSEDGSKGESSKLRKLLLDYKNKLTGFILPEDRKTMVVDINVDNPSNSENNENWEMYNFYHRPLVASITILSKLKNDVKNAESFVVDYLLKQTDSEVMKFDTIAAKVIPQSNYVLLGEEYKADVFLAAFNKTNNPNVQVGDYDFVSKTFNNTVTDVPVNKGLGKYVVKTSKEGIMTYSGVVKMKTGKNKEVVFPFTSEYIVAKPTVTVSADNMNVVYYGLENPISVSVPGIASEKTSVVATNGALVNKGNGKFILKPSAMNGNIDVTVYATTEKGEKRNMGTMTFRIKQVPKPMLKFGGLTASGSLSKGAIESQGGLIAEYNGFVFQSPIQAKVTSFKMLVFGAGGIEEYSSDSNSNKLTKAMFDRIKKMKKNERILFEEVKAIGPTGVQEDLLGFTIRVQ